MDGQNNPSYPWPYIEGLRMDEAMHDLTLLSTGIYGKDLTPQNGAPIRLVVPWKYGFKSIWIRNTKYLDIEKIIRDHPNYLGAINSIEEVSTILTQ